ncbi:hypothetical protein [Sulfurimonas sp.]|uniref:hypothetical protein n=1 Tax=Sulfurimonas sp. TaxID=2022749 RepID=UPI002AAF5016|nr:hypothetical protein [Sulfurimonas sp.]
MKPLLSTELPNFLKRFGDFVDAEIRSMEAISPTVIQVVIAAQDSARGFDWLSISLEFSNITDAKLINNSKLSLVDMSEGLTLFFQDNYFVLSINNYNNLSSVKDALFYIISSSIKYEEGLF